VDTATADLAPLILIFMRLDPVPIGGSAAQRAAEQELRKAEYHRDDPSLVSRAFAWLLRRLDAVFNGSAGSNALLIMLVLVLAIVIFAIARAGAPRRTSSLARAADIDPLAPVHARDHARLAARLEAEGRHSEALREWLRAAVQTIEDRGVLAPRPGRTGAATSREAGPLLPTAANALIDATSRFDEVWFGGRPATAEDAAAGHAAADAVRAARIVTVEPSPYAYAVPW